MKELIEMVGKKKGYSDIDIWNASEKIDLCISKLIKAECKLDIETLILISIEYSLSFNLQMKYKSILNYVQEEVA